MRSVTVGLWLRKASIRASALSGEGRPRARVSSLDSINNWPRLLYRWRTVASCPASSASSGMAIASWLNSS